MTPRQAIQEQKESKALSMVLTALEILELCCPYLAQEFRQLRWGLQDLHFRTCQHRRAEERAEATEAFTSKMERMRCLLPKLSDKLLEAELEKRATRHDT